MKKPVRALRCILLYCVLPLAAGSIASTAQAQWQLSGAFGGEGIYSVYFLDAVQASNIGFVGLGNGSVFRTVDGGRSWEQCSTSSQGQITSFAFADPTHGWMTCREKSGFGGLFETLDGGSTWNQKGPAGDIWCAWYANGRLFVTGNGFPLTATTNNGLTWSSPVIQPPAYLPLEQNGVVFSTTNGRNGVASDYSGSTLLTHDGGVSWEVSNYGSESWNPMASTGSIFYAVSEATWQVARSTDAGLTWNAIAGFRTKPTGDIHGSCEQLYMQTNTGLYASNTEGFSWYFIGGPPNAVDTRFYVQNGTTVYAGDSIGRLYVLNDALRPAMTPLIFTGAGMGETPPSLVLDSCAPIDTAIYVWAPSSCWATQLLGYDLKLSLGLKYIHLHGKDSIKLPTNVIDDTSSVAVQYDPTPVTYAHGTLDSVRIRLEYTPTPLPDSAIITLHFTLSGYEVDTTMTIYFSRNFRSNVSVPRIPYLFTVKHPCQTATAEIPVSNGVCDSVSIVDIHPADSVHFSVSQNKVPILLKPNTSVSIAVTASGSQPGTLYSWIYFTLSNDHVSWTDSVLAELVIQQEGPPHAGVPFPAVIAPLSICSRRLAVLHVQNLGCELLVFDSATWLASLPELTEFQMPQFPDTILPGVTDSIVLEFAPTTIISRTAEMLWYFHSKGGKIDTFVQIKVSSYSYPRAVLADSSLDFGTILSCDSILDSVYIRDESCETTTLEYIYPPNDPEFSVLSPALNTIISPGDSVKAVLKFQPSSIGTKNDAVEFLFQSAAGREQLLTAPFRATAVHDTLHALIYPTAIALDNIPPCGEYDTSIEVVNTSRCSTIHFSAQLSSNGWFSMDSDGVPISLPPGSSIIYGVHVSTSSDSAQSASITIQGDTNASVTLQARTIPLSVPEITTHYSDTLFYSKLCQSSEHSFWLRNEKCTPVELRGISLLGDAMRFTRLDAVSDTLLAPGDSLQIPIGYDAEDTFSHVAYLKYWTADGIISDSIFLMGVTTSRPQLASIAVQSADGMNPVLRQPGDTVSFLVYPMDDAADSLGLTAISAELLYDQNLLTYSRSAGMNGWNFSSQQNANGIDLEFQGNSLSKNQSIGQLFFTTDFSEPRDANVSISNVSFNHGDSDFSRCVLSSGASGNFTFGIAPFCADTIYGDALLKLPLWVTNIEVSNSTKNTMITVGFHASQSETIDCRIYDERGEAIEELGSYFIAVGNSSLPFTLQLPSGVYFLLIESSGNTISKKFTVEK